MSWHQKHASSSCLCTLHGRTPPGRPTIHPITAPNHPSHHTRTVHSSISIQHNHQHQTHPPSSSSCSMIRFSRSMDRTWLVWERGKARSRERGQQATKAVMGGGVCKDAGWVVIVRCYGLIVVRWIERESVGAGSGQGGIQQALSYAQQSERTHRGQGQRRAGA